MQLASPLQVRLSLERQISFQAERHILHDTITSNMSSYVHYTAGRPFSKTVRHSNLDCFKIIGIDTESRIST